MKTVRKASIWQVSKLFALDLKHLRYAVAAGDCGSIRRAADTLRVRHSALSRSISQLERLIGTVLFERSSGGVKPTAAGRGILRIAVLILEQVEMLAETGCSCERGQSGHISVGFCTSISAGNLRATLSEFRKVFSQIEITTVERSRIRLTNALRNGTVDVVIAPGDLLCRDSKALPLWSERILVSLPEDHLLAGRDVVYWTDLSSETVLLSHYDPGRDLEDLLLHKLGHSRPRIEKHDVSRGIIKSLVSMGLGISLSMDSDTGAGPAGLAYREIHDGSGGSRIDFCAEWRADNENPALGSFLNLLRERYSSPVAERV